jgi:tetratricopeptide (TPR) repeat protein
MRPRLSGPLPNWVYGQTNHAFLCPTNGILIVSRLDGPTAQIARSLVDKAIQAETTGLWGRAYFDARGLEKTNNYYLGDQWILGAAELCREIGYETIVDNRPDTFSADFPMSQIAIYCGWYDGSVSGPFAQSKVEFMPGAFAYHLHSSSAASIRIADQFWIGPLLAKGATCTMGAVNEPYLTVTPNVAIFIARLMANGFTFGEAAIVAQPALSWQTTIVGDPLYRPFGKEPVQLHAELTRANNPLIAWSHLRVINGAIVRNAPSIQVAKYLETIPARTNSAILTEKLADVYTTEGKPESAIEMYRRALTLNPSPQQKIRLRLALGEKLIEQNHETDAIENYSELLKESLDYPGKNRIREKIATLEQKSFSTHAPVKP